MRYVPFGDVRPYNVVRFNYPDTDGVDRKRIIFVAEVKRAKNGNLLLCGWDLHCVLETENANESFRSFSRDKMGLIQSLCDDDIVAAFDEDEIAILADNLRYFDAPVADPMGDWHG